LCYFLLKDCFLNNKEETCEIDKVKLEVEEAEITVEDHGVKVDSMLDHHRLVNISNSCMSAKCIDLVIETIFMYWTPQNKY
jgi:hypothetical protein